MNALYRKNKVMIPSSFRTNSAIQRFVLSRSSLYQVPRVGRVKTSVRCDTTTSTGTTTRNFGTSKAGRIIHPKAVPTNVEEVVASKSFAETLIPVAVVPVMFLMYGISEHFWTNRQIQLNEELRQQFEAEHTNLENEGTRPFLFYCVIRRTRYLTHSVSNVQVGDVVEVLEEGVGPNKEYNLCRFPAPVIDQQQEQEQQYPHGTTTLQHTVGWFPTRWLQKLEDYERIAQQSEGVTVGHLKD